MLRMAHSNSRRVMSLVVAVLCLGVVASAQKPPDVVPDTDLALSAEQTARATGMSPLFDHIRELSSKLSSDSSSEKRWELFSLRQQALMEVTAASMEVDATTGQMYDFRARLTHMKRDLAVLLGSIASAMPVSPPTGQTP